jgi:hypothetical protein
MGGGGSNREEMNDSTSLMCGSHSHLQIRIATRKRYKSCPSLLDLVVFSLVRKQGVEFM